MSFQNYYLKYVNCVAEIRDFACKAKTLKIVNSIGKFYRISNETAVNIWLNVCKKKHRTH